MVDEGMRNCGGERLVRCGYLVCGRVCGEAADTRVTVDVLDVDGAPSVHCYCNRHGWFAECDLTVALVMSDRVKDVRVSVVRQRFPIVEGEC